MNDPVLSGLEEIAVGVRGYWIEIQTGLKKEGHGTPQHLISPEPRLVTYPTDGGHMARLSWYYNHVWSGPTAFNVAAMMIMHEAEESGPPYMSKEDLVVYTTHLANTFEAGDLTFLVRVDLISHAVSSQCDLMHRRTTALLHLARFSPLSHRSPCLRAGPPGAYPSSRSLFR